MKLSFFEHLHLGPVLHVLVTRFGSTGAQQAFDAIEKAHTAGVSIFTIITTILSMLATVVGGGSLSLQDIINAILALIGKKP